MPEGDADRIRTYLCEQVERARCERKVWTCFRIGDVRETMGLSYADAAIDIGQVLKTRTFREQAQVECLDKVGSGESLSSAFLFKIL